MKPTKNQADAVRAYLASLNCDISHVQALEVLARGAGLRSRHVKTADAAPATATAPAAAPAAGPTAQAHYAVAPQSQVHMLAVELIRCGQELAAASSAPDLAQLRRLREQLSQVIHRQEYEAIQARALAIQQAYLASNCTSADVDHAVEQLMRECGVMFDTDRHAWSFLMDEPHEELETVWLLELKSDLYGTTLFEYGTPDEREAGLKSLMEGAEYLADNVTRSYYFIEVPADLEKGTPEYQEALLSREFVGRVGARD